MTSRLNPLRPKKISKKGVKRVILQAVPKSKETHALKPIRTPANSKTRFLVIAHSDRGALDAHAQQTIAAAAMLADAQTSVLVLVLGELHEKLNAVGADEVMVLPSLNYQQFQPDIELAAVQNVLDSIHPTRIFMPDNAIGDGDLGRRLIASRQVTAATNVVEINAQHIACLQAGGRVLAQTNLPKIILLAPNVVDVELPFTGAAKRIATNAPKLSASAYTDQGLQATVASDIALEEADFIVSAGNGVQNLGTLEKLAQALNASIGASRVVVDDGKMPRDKQIGATGKTVSASTYFAIGISGAVQHLQGIKDCRHVIAINKDASAPIIKRADFSVIGDAEDLMQALISEIAKAKALS